MTENQLAKVTLGNTFFAEDAQKLKLIDQVGRIDDAFAALREQTTDSKSKRTRRLRTARARA